MKELSRERELNIGKILVEMGVFLLLLNVLTAAHLWEAIWQRWQIAGEGVLLEQAWIRQDTSYSFTTWDINTCYVLFLRFLFSFFGNHQQVVTIANFFLQLTGLFLFYRGSRRLGKAIVALIITGIMGSISIIFFPITHDNAYHLVWFGCGVLCWIVSFVKPIWGKINTGLETERVQAKPMEEAMPVEEIMPMKEAVPEDSNKEKAEAIQFIPNPLPLPKKHVKKEMDYAFEPPKELMHYDLNNYDVNDDYDLKEL